MTCPVCTTATLPRARFCHRCGAALAADRGLGDGSTIDEGRDLPVREFGRPSRPDPGPGSEIAGNGGLDRRVVTILVADLVGYSRLVAACDPEEVQRRMDDLFARLAACVERFGGSVEKFIGDAVFAVFGVPVAHDDDALRAVVCARAIRDAVRSGATEGMPAGPRRGGPTRGSGESSTEAGDGGGLPGEVCVPDEVEAPGSDEARLELRLGLATGEVVTGQRALGGRTDRTVTGLAAALASRIAELARPGEILLDPETALAARHRVEVEPTDRAVVVPGRPALALLRLVGLRSPLAIAAGPSFIGRWRERERLRRALEAVEGTGSGRVVLVVGEAGIGKSRLLADLEADARAAGFRWTWTEHLSYRANEPYASAREFVDRIADEFGQDAGSLARQLVLDDDLEPARARRYAGAIAAFAREAGIEGWEAELALAPADPAAVAATLLEVGLRFVRRLAEVGGRRVVVLDDLHWEDPASRPITEHLIGGCRDLPFLVLGTIRPGPLPSWAALPHVEVLELGGLDVSETERLVEAVVGVDLAATDAARLRERTEGNPLFILETVRSLLEEGAANVEEGRLVVDPVRLVSGSPLTLRAMLGARLDTLASDERTLLEVASVVGMSFDLETVERLLERPVGEEELLRLGRAGFVSPTSTAGRWRFAHPLVHEATRARMLAARRMVLHARLADLLEAAVPPPPLSQLAVHRAVARDPRAIPLLARAADEAIAAGAVVEAAGFFRMAAELASDPPSAERFRRLAVLALSRGQVADRGVLGGASA